MFTKSIVNGDVILSVKDAKFGEVRVTFNIVFDFELRNEVMEIASFCKKFGLYEAVKNIMVESTIVEDSGNVYSSTTCHQLVICEEGFEIQGGVSDVYSYISDFFELNEVFETEIDDELLVFSR